MTAPLTIAEVAALERVDERTIRKEIHACRLVARKIGTIYRIDPEALEDWRRATIVKPSKPKRTNFRGVLKAAEGRGS